MAPTARGTYFCTEKQGGIKYIIYFDVEDGKPANVSYGIAYNVRNATPVPPYMQARLYAAAGDWINRNWGRGDVYEPERKRDAYMKSGGTRTGD